MASLLQKCNKHGLGVKITCWHTEAQVGVEALVQRPVHETPCVCVGVRRSVLEAPHRLVSAKRRLNAAKLIDRSCETTQLALPFGQDRIVYWVVI